MPLTLTRGTVWRGKTPRAASYGVFDDRRISFATHLQVSYTGPDGGSVVSREDFEKWAGREVTQELPVGGWAPFVRGAK